MKKSAKPKRPARVHQLKITLLGIRPPIWRRVTVQAEMPLSELHGVIQIAMGWCDGHLHLFRFADRFAEEVFSLPEFELEEEVRDERRYTVDQVLSVQGQRMIYEYDFGDGWEHEILLEKVLPRDPDAAYPICIKGKRACPPEDCGGPWGYADLLEALADPKHERHGELTEWLDRDFDSEAFDIDEVNAAFGQGDHSVPLLLALDQEPQANILPIHPHKPASGPPKMDAPIWIGTAFETMEPNGDATVIWIEMLSENCIPLALEGINLSASPEAPIVTGFRIALENAQRRGLPKPNTLIVPFDRDAQPLTECRECRGVSVWVSRECVPVLLSEIGAMHRQRLGETPLNLYAPVPGDPGISEKLVSDLYRALASFRTARPWTGVDHTDAFRIAFPNGTTRIVTLMGNAGEEYGAVLFNSLEAIRTLSEFVPEALASETAKPEFPGMMGFSFELHETCHPGLADHLDLYGGQWFDQDRHPIVRKYTAQHAVPLACEDIETLTMTAAVLARYARQLKKTKSWPPEHGSAVDIPISTKRSAPAAHVEFIGPQG